METAPLKSFATWARTALIREVTARVAVVLAPASPERVEQPKAVDALEKAVNAAGGGDKGRAAVADRVAYTWFNRIIALRFMDANGYTDTGVVSPQAGVEGGQPEILAEAKRGIIDAAIVGTKIREAVTGLLNGTRRSADPQGEAYALLLAEYCRHWNRAMPFMFEREGDFTELLIPANLLADDSVLNRTVKVLIIFPLLFYRTSVQLRCPAAPPGGGLRPPGRPPGLGHLLVGHPGFALRVPRAGRG